MIVSITGPRGGKVDEGLKHLIFSAVVSFSKQLDIHRLKTKIDIRVHTSRMVDGYAEGYCECLDPRTFVVDICLYSNWLAVLAHEFVHIKQYARGELSADGKKWMKTKIDDEQEYYDQPWEKEAFRLQYKLVQEFDKRPI